MPSRPPPAPWAGDSRSRNRRIRSSTTGLSRKRTSFPELLVRYGMTEKIELRLGWNFEVGGAGDVVSGGEGATGL